MIELLDKSVLLVGGKFFESDTPAAVIEEQTGIALSEQELRDAAQGSIAKGILSAHNTPSSDDGLHIKFDALASHDITYVGIVQTARASGLQSFPVPYVLTNCHNSLCAVGGTINEDDHLFGLSAARKYGGIFVPAHMAVIHQYMREMFAGCGRMILGSDSHTRYGALGTMAVGEGGPELVKQLLGRTYDVAQPRIIAVQLKGKPRPGIGPHDVALAIIRAVFANGFVKNAVMEFVGEGISSLSVDYRNGIDVMTTETTCLSSIWQTDDKVQVYLAQHGRADSYRELKPARATKYDGALVVYLDEIPSMIALPFHPSNAFPVSDFNANSEDLLAMVEKEAHASTGISLSLRGRKKNGRVLVEQGVIAGCAGGTFENISMAAQILRGKMTGVEEFWLSVYPASQPINMQLVHSGVAEELMGVGATYRTAFCGPCFGAGDVPANNSLSIRHTTRNFVNREGSKPKDGQMSAVALMDARSIAATAANGGLLTGADELGLPEQNFAYRFDDLSYRARVYQGFGNPQPTELRMGPNITDWPSFQPLPENMILEVVSVLRDEVTTTDELIPSGDTSSFRSNPERLAQYTLSRRDPEYVNRAKAVREMEKNRENGEADGYLSFISEMVDLPLSAQNTGIGSVVCAYKPGDGSAREQAASCQKVLGGWANVAREYATKRYRSNLVNWGMLPLVIGKVAFEQLEVGDKLVIPGIRAALLELKREFPATIVKGDDTQVQIMLSLPGLTEAERDIILSGCLINYYAEKK